MVNAEFFNSGPVILLFLKSIIEIMHIFHDLLNLGDSRTRASPRMCLTKGLRKKEVKYSSKLSNIRD